MAPAIEFSHVAKDFGGRRVLADLSFAVARGELVTILGSSGSGKTTTLKLVNGLLTPDGGTVRVGGKPLADQDLVELRRHIGYVVQQTGLFPHLTVGENIAVVPRLLGWPKEKIQARVADLLALVRLDPACADRVPRQLSGGQQQRVGVARALAANPPYVLFDEPFGALDALTRQELQGEVRRIHRSLAGKTFLFVTHDINEALYLGQRVLVMKDGAIEQFAAPAELVAHPATVQQNRALWGWQDD